MHRDVDTDAIAMHEETMPTIGSPTGPVGRIEHPVDRSRLSVSRRTAIRRGILFGGAVLLGSGTLPGVAVGRSNGDEEDALPTGLYAEVENEIQGYKMAVFVGFDGEVSVGEPDDEAYFESEVEIKPVEKEDTDEDPAGDGTEVKVKVKKLSEEIEDALDELEDNQSVDNFEIQQLVLIVEADSTTIGVSIDSRGNVATFSGDSDGVGENGLIVAVRFEDVDTSLSLVELDIVTPDDGPVVK